MRFQHVCVEALCYRLPDEVVTSADIESRLAGIYQRLDLPAGRLELMTGIRERRFFPPGTLPGEISALTAEVEWLLPALSDHLWGSTAAAASARPASESDGSNRR